MFAAYMLRCADGRFYIGHTDNLATRMAQHESGMAGAFTRTRRPVELVWSETFPTRLEALSAERQLKGCSRAKKQAMIAGDWQALRRLSRSGTRPSTGSGRTAESGGPLDAGMCPSTGSGRTAESGGPLDAGMCPSTGSGRTAESGGALDAGTCPSTGSGRTAESGGPLDAGMNGASDRAPSGSAAPSTPVRPEPVEGRVKMALETPRV